MSEERQHGICLREIQDPARPYVSEICAKPAASVCERHLTDDLETAKQEAEAYLRAGQAVVATLRELVKRVEEDAAARTRLYAAVDAAKTVLSR